MKTMKKNIFLLLCVVLPTLGSCAQAPAKTFIVSFDTDHGDFIKPLKIVEGNLINKEDITNPTKEGVSFYKWYKDKEFSEEFDFNSPITGDLILYARYGFTVTFLGKNEETETIYATEIVPMNDKVSKPDNPSKDYYTFDKWYQEENFKHEFDFETKITKNLSVFAKFNPNDYKITYHNILDTDTNVNPKGYVYSIGVNDLKNAKREENEFRGWFTSETFEEETRITSIPADSHRDIDLYAKFSNVFYISFVNWPEDLENANPSTYTKNDAITLDSSIFNDEKYKNGFNFENFYLVKDGKTETNPITGWDAGTTMDKIIYVDIAPTESVVTLDAKGGKLDSEFSFIYLDYNYDEHPIEKIENIAQEGSEEEGFNPNGINVPNREGYNFGGWYLDKDCQTPLSTEEDNILHCGDTIYAKWNPLDTEKGYKSLSDNNGKFEVSVSDIAKGKTGYVRLYLNIPYHYEKISFDYGSLLYSQSGLLTMNGWCGGENFISYVISDTKFDTYENLYTKDKSDLSFSQYLDLRWRDSGYTSFRFGVTSITYRDDQKIKIATDTAKAKIKFWDKINFNTPTRDGYKFKTWLDSDNKEVTNGSHWNYVNTEVTVNASWAETV